MHKKLYYKGLFITIFLGCSLQIYTQIVVEPAGLVNDIDGNIYQTIKIGSQIWMVENLKVQRYRNGDLIPIVQDTIKWFKQTEGASCYYDNQLYNAINFGRLYNWYAVNDSRRIAPDGWHIPTDLDWQILVSYLNGNITDVAQMPIGGALIYGSYLGFGHWAHYWTAKEMDNENAYCLEIGPLGEKSAWYRGDKNNGCYVKCIKD